MVLLHSGPGPGGTIPNRPDDSVLDNIANGHAGDGQASEFPGQSLRKVIGDTIDNATHGGPAHRGWTLWWYNSDTKVVVCNHPVPNSHGELGTVFRVTAPNYQLPDGPIVNPK